MKIMRKLCVSDANIRNFQLVWPTRIHFEVVFVGIVIINYVLRNKSTNTIDILYRVLPTRYYWLIEKNHMFPTQKCQNFGSLAPLARNHLCVFSSFCFSGRNKSSWTRPYHECYEHKDIIYCTDKPCDLSTEYWGESYVSDPKYHKFRLPRNIAFSLVSGLPVG